MAKYENPAELDYRNGGDTVDDFAQKYMRTVDYIIKALNDLRTPTGNTAGVEPEPYMWRIADNKLYIRNADNTDYVLLGEISPNFGFRQSVNDKFLTTADLEGDGAVVTRNEAGKVEGDITGSPGKIAGKTIDVTPTADNDVIAYDAAQQKWVKKTLNDYLKKQGDAGWDEMVDEVADQVINDITPIIFNFWYLDDDGYLVPLVGSTEGGLPSIHGMVGDYEQITARSVDVAGNLSATGNVTAGMVTTPQANVGTLTANAVNANSASVTEISAGKITADKIIYDNAVYYYFPMQGNNNGDCEIIKTPTATIMIDAGAIDRASYILDFCVNHGITKIDYFLLTHYHLDHYGNIEDFIGQNVVDFSATHWYIPVHAISEDETGYNAVTGWLASRNVTFVDDDMSISIDDNVSMDLFNATQADRDYYAAQTTVDLNEFSICALVKYGDVTTLYTGDTMAVAQQRLYETGRCDNVNLLKVGHHGSNGGMSGNSYFPYIKAIHPQESVINFCHRYMLESIASPVVSDLTALGANTNFTYDGDAQYVSYDGKTLLDVSDDKTRKKHNVPFEHNVKVYVDGNVDVSVVPDGTSEKPYKSINEALALTPNNPSIRIDIYIAAGTYGDTYIKGRNQYIIILPQGNITFTNLTLFTSDMVQFGNTGTVTITQHFLVDGCEIFIESLVLQNLGPIGCRFQGTRCTIQNLTITNNTAIERPICFFGGAYGIRNMTVSGQRYTAQVKEGAIVGVNKLTATNVTDTVFRINDICGGIVQLGQAPTLTNTPSAIISSVYNQ